MRRSLVAGATSAGRRESVCVRGGGSGSERRGGAGAAKSASLVWPCTHLAMSSKRGLGGASMSNPSALTLRARSSSSKAQSP